MSAARSALHVSRRLVQRQISSSVLEVSIVRARLRRWSNKTGSSISDSLKRKASKILDESSQAASAALRQGQSTAWKTIQDSSMDVSKHVTKGSQAMTAAASETLQKTSTQLQSTVSKSSRRVAEKVSGATKSAAKQTSQTIQHSSKAAAREASTKIKESTTGALKGLETRGRKVLGWFWWWSLAAIGVYGMATTIPKELIRYALAPGNDEKKKVVEATTSTNPDGSENSLNWTSRIFEGGNREEQDRQKAWKFPWSS